MDQCQTMVNIVQTQPSDACHQNRDRCLNTSAEVAGWVLNNVYGSSTASSSSDCNKHCCLAQAFIDRNIQHKGYRALYVHLSMQQALSAYCTCNGGDSVRLLELEHPYDHDIGLFSILGI